MVTEAGESLDGEAVWNQDPETAHIASIGLLKSLAVGQLNENSPRLLAWRPHPVSKISLRQ